VCTEAEQCRLLDRSATEDSVSFRLIEDRVEGAKSVIPGEKALFRSIEAAEGVLVAKR
jgi:hypothetical protein